MSDVEKYGMFAVVFVGGLLLLIAVQGGFGDGSTAASVAPVVIDADAFPDADGAGLKSAAQSTRLTAANRGQPAPGPRSLRLKSLLPEQSFDWNGGPGGYPGERSVTSGSARQQAATRTVQRKPGTPVADTYVVRAGDTLSEISQRMLGSSGRTRDLFEANRDRLKSVDDLSIGQVLVMPGAVRPTARGSRRNRVARADPPGTPAEAPKTTLGQPARHTHTVLPGDTLGAISQAYLGTARRAQEIFEANRTQLKSPDALSVGQVLAIP